MKTLEDLCYVAATKARYWPYLETHVKLWWIMNKFGKV
jgi:hypothetical protein